MPYYMHELSVDYNPAIGMIQHMSTDELKQLLNEEDRLEDFVKNMKQVKLNETQRKTLLDNNKVLAEFNLSQEPIIVSLRTTLMETYNKLTKVKEEVEGKKQKLDDIKKQMSLDTTLALLQAASAEAEEESEVISENFLSGELPIDDFLEVYMKKRKNAHLRRVKVEKMTELLNKQESATSNYNISALAFGYKNTPYPVQPNMPMPFFR